MPALSDDVMMAHLVLSIPMVTGVAQVASAMTRWPRRFPADPERQLELSRLLLPKALKALGGTALVDLSLAAIFATLAPPIALSMLAAGLLMLGAMLTLPPSGPGPWRGITPGRPFALIAWARRLTLVAAVIAAGSVAIDRLSWDVFVVVFALLFAAGALRRWASSAIAELVQDSSSTTPG
jgi:hypothetical protein